MILQYKGNCISKNSSLLFRDLKVIGEKIVENWWRKEGHRIDPEDVTDILNASPEVLVVGTGYAGFMEVPNALRLVLKRKNIQLIAEKTPEAVRTFNQLHSRSKRVAAAFHLTC